VRSRGKSQEIRAFFLERLRKKPEKGEKERSDNWSGWRRGTINGIGGKALTTGQVKTAFPADTNWGGQGKKRVSNPRTRKPVKAGGIVKGGHGYTGWCRREEYR